MIIVQCICGAGGKAPPALAGKTVRCKKCSAPIVIPGGAAPSVADDIYDVVQPVSRPGMYQSTLDEPPPIPPPSPPRVAAAPIKRKAEPSSRSFWSDLALSFGFMFRPTNLLVLICAVLLALFGELVPVLFVALIPYVILCALYMGTIVETANGSDDLPNGGGFEGVGVSLVLPLVRFVGVSAILALLAVVLIGAATLSMEDETSAAAVGAAIGAAVAFFWPIAMLMVALGGVLTLFRIDLMVRSIVTAFVPYLAIWAALLVALALQVGPAMLMGEAEGSDAADPFADAPARAVFSVVSIYSTLVAMRCIGLFYRHYSDRFPWSAG